MGTTNWLQICENIFEDLWSWCERYRGSEICIIAGDFNIDLNSYAWHLLTMFYLYGSLRVTEGVPRLSLWSGYRSSGVLHPNAFVQHYTVLVDCTMCSAYVSPPGDIVMATIIYWHLLLSTFFALYLCILSPRWSYVILFIWS